MSILDLILAGASAGDRPAAPAAVAIIAVNGAIAERAAAGVTRRWADDLGAVEARGYPPVTPDTLFDLASVTKLFTAAALLITLDAHGLRDSDPVATVLPEFESGLARHSTFADLLRHTGGWAAEWPDRRPDDSAWRRFRSGRPAAPSGGHYRYSCVGYIWAGLAAAQLADAPLDQVITRTLLAPLGMNSTCFRPDASLRGTIAATEYQRVPNRGLVHGEVHDETAWALGGVSGNAGLFGSAPDLLRFAELLRRRGEHEGHRLLPEWIAEAMTRDRLPPGVGDRPAYGQALGPRVAERSWMGALADRGAVGHTGFTGTSLLAVPGGSHSVIILTNRVHPSRDWSDVRALRHRIADEAAEL